MPAKFALRAFLAVAVAPVWTATAGTKPTITAGVITSALVDVTRTDAAPSIDLAIDGKANSIALLLQGPSGQFANETFQFPAFPAHTTLRGYSVAGGFSFVNNAFSLYTQPGTWSLVTIDICGPGGCSPPYVGASLSALFPSLTFTIRNPNKPDMLAPMVKKGAIETQTVSLGSGKPVRINLIATDDVSGVAAVNITATLTGGGTQIGGEIVQFPHPSRRVEAPIAVTLDGAIPPGTYTITGVICTDIAGNFRQYSDPGSINAIFDNHASFTVVP